MAFSAENEEDGGTMQIGLKACERWIDNRLLFVVCSILYLSADVNMCFTSCLHTHDTSSLLIPGGWPMCCCALAVDSCPHPDSSNVSMVLP